MFPGAARWPDQNGKIVEILHFFSVVFSDEESRELDEESFPFTEYKVGNYDGGFFGKAEIETVVNIILDICAIFSRVVGVEKNELIMIAKAMQADYIESLIKDGFLREKLVKGVLVVFPTKKLLEQFEFPQKAAHAAQAVR